MTTDDIIAKLSEAKIISLDSDATHLMLFDRNQVLRETLQSISKFLEEEGHRFVLLSVDNPETAARVVEIPKPEAS